MALGFSLLGYVALKKSNNFRLVVPFGFICQISQQGEGGLFRNLANPPN